MEKILLDVHAHVAPILPDRLAGIAGVTLRAAEGHAMVDGQRVGLEPVSRPEALVEWMDRNQVERAWISIPPPLYRLELGEAAAKEWTSYVNDGLRAMAARFPDRLSAMLHLPLQQPALAAAIVADRAAGAPRFAMPAGSAAGKLALSDAAYAPLWAALDRAEAFLFLHPSKGCDPRLDAFYLHNLLGNPNETAIAAAHLAMSGILERHPGMQVCLAHGGGSAAAVAGRLERGQSTGRPGADTGALPVRQAFRHFCVDCITHDAATLRLAAETFGADKVLFGSDWPFAMGLPEPHRQLADIDAGLRQRIFQANPARLRKA